MKTMHLLTSRDRGLCIGADAPASARAGRFARVLQLCTAVVAALMVVAVAAPVVSAAPLGVLGVSGSNGTGDGQFQGTGGVAVNESTGDVYVIDLGGQRVERFNAVGEFQDSFGTAGTSDGQFAFETVGRTSLTPQLAVDQTDGSVYVTDTGNDRVQKFDAAGGYESQFGSNGTGNGQFRIPTGVAVDPTDGSVYVADNGNYRVQKFTGTGLYLTRFGAKGTVENLEDTDADGLFSAGAGPGQVGVDSAGRVYVLDPGNNRRVQRFTSAGVPDGTIAHSFSTLAAGALAVDPNGDHVFVGRSTVQEWNEGGELVDTHAPDAAIMDQSITGIGLKAGAAAYTTGLDGYDGSLSPRLYRLGALTPASVVVQPVSDIEGRGVTVNATINPNGPPAASYQIEYTADFGETFITRPEAPVPVGTGTTDVAVSRTLSDLMPNNFYLYRVIVKRAYNADVATDYDFFQTLTVAPTVSRTGATGLERSAELRATVNPESIETTYQFEYGSSDAYGSVFPAAPVSVGDGRADVAVARTIGGLQPGTTYHFRVIATNDAGTTAGPDQTFTTAVPGVPGPAQDDGRAYEQVSPLEKNGNYISEVVSIQAAPSGDAVAFGAGGAFAGAPSSVQGMYYRARRTPSGWITDPVTPPQQNTGTATSTPTLAFSEDLTSAVSFSQKALTPGVVDGLSNLYRHTSATDGFELVASTDSGWLINEYATPIEPLGVAVDAKLEHFAFETRAPLTPDAAPGNNVYESVNGALRLVNRLPDGSISTAGLKGGPARLAVNGRFMSDDGQRLFFVSPSDTAEPYKPIYVRLGGETTRLITRSHRPGDDPTVALGGTLWGASADGSTVYFVSQAALTTDSTGAKPGDGDLYRYDVDNDALTNLTPLRSSGEVNVAAVSDNGDYVYFVATSVLAPGARPGGVRNLYVAHGDEVRLVATPIGVAGLATSSEFLPNGVDISADGRHLAFSTFGPATGAPNRNVNCQPGDLSDQGNFFDQLAAPPNTCSNVFVYDAVEDELVCASCGAVASGDRHSVVYGGNRDISGRSGRSMLDDGSAYFTSAEGLVKADVNGREDVYRWKDGVTTLISSGTSDEPSIFMGATPDGDDVFFLTSEALVAQDTDGLQDLYDARVGGGIAAQNAASAGAPPCDGEACQGAPSVTAPQASPPTGAASDEPEQSPRRPAARLKVVSGRSAIGSTAVLRVRLPSGGRLSASGTGLVTTTKPTTGAGTYDVRVRLSAGGRRALAHRRKVARTVRLAFTPSGGAREVVRVGLTFKRPAPAKVSARRATVSFIASRKAR